MNVEIYLGFMACGSAWWGVRFKLVLRAALARTIPDSAIVRESRTSATVPGAALTDDELREVPPEIALESVPLIGFGVPNPASVLTLPITRARALVAPGGTRRCAGGHRHGPPSHCSATGHDRCPSPGRTCGRRRAILAWTGSWGRWWHGSVWRKGHRGPTVSLGCIIMVDSRAPPSLQGCTRSWSPTSSLGPSLYDGTVRGDRAPVGWRPADWTLFPSR